MRTYVKALAGLAFGATLALATPPQALAADADVSVRVKRVKVVYRTRAVRDYDGTPIVFRIAPPHLQRDYGIGPTYEAIAVPRATPRTYLNGEPVLPTTRVLGDYYR
jgi:hypothetical protein